MQRPLTLTVIAALALAASALAGPQVAGALLDGKTFEIRLVEQDKSEPQRDSLIFAEGTFDSTGCRQYGFARTPYTVERKGEAWHFAAEAKSEKEGTNRWKGIVSGNHIAGTLVWSKPGQATINYTFTGEIKE